MERPLWQQGCHSPYPLYDTKTFWGRDILKDVGAVLTTDDRIDLMTFRSMKRQDWQIVILCMSSTPLLRTTLPQKSTIIMPPSPISLTWLLNQVIWVEQWPIIQSKLSILKELVIEQLKMGNIELPTSKHHTPIFVMI